MLSCDDIAQAVLVRIPVHASQSKDAGDQLMARDSGGVECFADHPVERVGCPREPNLLPIGASADGSPQDLPFHGGDNGKGLTSASVHAQDRLRGPRHAGN